ncbi:MAG: cbb3-type cytochrome c oxidase subunit II [Pseudomonadota bacterium]|nr:cbb3-type cytochrome c oxidase subunit II [Pseudomonadota bacterium]
MNLRVWLLLLGAVAIMSFAAMVLVVVPAALLTEVKPSPGLEPYTASEASGRGVYIREGCMYCHSQQVRDTTITTDEARGWGRPSVPGDYVYDAPHQLGTMRTGPDLMNVGARLPDRRWQLLHLYQPRAVVPWSIMPSFPYLFEVKAQAGPDDEVVTVPPAWAPESGVVVAGPEAVALVDYLLSLDHTQPLAPTEATPRAR